MAALVSLGACAAARGATAAKQFLMISDIHFDPMAEPTLVDRLAAAEPSRWLGILDSGDDRSPSRYGADTNWPLLRSALAQMNMMLPHPAFLLLPGDFLAHHFRAQFNAAARDHSDQAYRQFVIKTMRFISGEIEHAFPDTPIFPALGNNDAECGDFMLQPNGEFLSDTLPILRGLVGSNAPGLGRSWLSYGNYRVNLPGIPDISVVVLNTVFFSPKYRDACGSHRGLDPARQTLAWLAKELAAAQHAHRRVWLVYHVPPGIDGYRTWGRGSCPDHIIPMWTATSAARFDDLVGRYRDAIAASFAGHTQMDDFRLLGDGGNSGFVLITPALSPIFGQNPAYRIVTFDPSGAILDQTTYDLGNLAEAAEGAPAKWRTEYTFTREWRLRRIDVPNLKRLYAMITTVPDDRRRWHSLFAVSSPIYWRLNRGGDPIRAFDCATGNTGIAAFRRCWCGGGYPAGYLVPNRRSPASPSPGRM